mmetsp:Transcript_4685/g.13079  ORF Transcript_4685/g.13079 Transcript_4685/m.13079 type:complete len:209 (-) Transcript_4685:149-775(-)
MSTPVSPLSRACATFSKDSLSFICIRKYREMEGTTAPKARAKRQVNSNEAPELTKASMTIAESKYPKPWFEKTSAIKVPRRAAPVPSAQIVADSGYSPPMPKPRMPRQKISWYIRNFGPSENSWMHAEARDPKMINEPVTMKITLRPNLSARDPKMSCPRIAPNNAADEVRLFRYNISSPSRQSLREDWLQANSSVSTCSTPPMTYKS